MYEVNGSMFTSFRSAVDAAKSIGAEVYEVRTDGSKQRRWAPAAPASAAKLRMYRERKNAYEAYKRTTPNA